MGFFFERSGGFMRVLCCSRKGPRVGDGHGEAEEGEADFRERCGYV
jgi:hypothetical protein